MDATAVMAEAAEEVIVKVRRTCVVKPAMPTPRQTMFLSNLDLVWLPISNVQTLYFYPHSPLIEYSSLIQGLKKSLSSVLVYFYPLAGQLKKGESGKTEVDCNDQGVEFREASINTPFHDLEKDGFRRKPFFPKLVHEVHLSADENYSRPLLLIQVTAFEGGGICIGTTIHHVIADGISYFHFMTSWAECSRGLPITKPPQHARTVFKRENKSPLPISYKAHEIVSNDITGAKIFKFETDDSEHLKTSGSNEAIQKWVDPKRKIEVIYSTFCFTEEIIQDLKQRSGASSSFVAVVAQFWRCVIRAREVPPEEAVSLSVLADCRGRVKPPLLPTYFGNCLSVGLAQITANTLINAHISFAADVIQQLINSCTEEAQINYLIDWAESGHRRNLMNLLIDAGKREIISKFWIDNKVLYLVLILNWALAMDILSSNNGGTYQMFQREAVVDTLVDVVMCLVPVWLAVMIGLVVGWAWKPKWASLLFVGLRSLRPQLLLTAPHGFSAALTALMGFPLLRKLWASFRDWESEHEEAFDHQINPEEDTSHVGKEPVVTNGDLEHLCCLLEEKDGGPVWHQVMDRTTPTMSYQAWRRDRKVGPPQYRSRTVYEDVTPELLRDFFWDDEFRVKWDGMQLYTKTLEECPQTGTMIVHWIKKFPAFCSDREYVIGRRIWESGRTYFCVTKGVPYPSLPRHNKPRRVDLYYSSWSIRAVESRKGDGQLSACEVMLFHHEDMGIPWEIAKLGVRQGMWGAVRNIERGICAYKIERRSEAPLSRCAFMARINSKVPADLSRTLGLSSEDTKDSQDIILSSKETEGGHDISKTRQGNGWKFIIIGGAMALACGLDRGIVSKAIIFGVARRLGNIGKRQ